MVGAEVGRLVNWTEVGPWVGESEGKAIVVVVDNPCDVGNQVVVASVGEGVGLDVDEALGPAVGVTVGVTDPAA